MHLIRFFQFTGALGLAVWLTAYPIWAQSLRVATFDVDASPRIGTPMAYDPTKGVIGSLRCRGIILLGAEKPVVLCAVDWLGISNSTNDAFRSQLAEAAGSTPDRVAIHTLHQHDAPRCDGSSADILREFQRDSEFYDTALWQDVIQRASGAIRESLTKAREVSHYGVGKAEVMEVASNRRILDANGKVVVTRYTACKDPVVQAMPVGVVDPHLRILAFYSGDQPIVALTYYATHPQSYYRTGMANVDFPGMARDHRQEITDTMHIHFNGAGGNIGAGKFNDGSVPMRQLLADRVADGMKRAWDSIEGRPINADEVHWASTTRLLPLADHLEEKTLLDSILNESTPPLQVSLASEQLAFVRRHRSGIGVPIGCLRLGKTYILHMPGELFVEYQLAAQAMRPTEEVLMAAYGDYGPFYIGTRIAYPQGGYETSSGASNVAPECEGTLLKAMEELLGVTKTGVHASDFTDTIGPGLPEGSK